MAPRTSTNPLLRVLLKATALPDDFYAFLATYPGPDGQFALAALCRPDLPIGAVDPLYQALAPGRARQQAEGAALAAVRRAGHGQDPAQVAGQFLTDMATSGGEGWLHTAVGVLVDRVQATDPLFRELLHQGNREVLEYMTAWATGDMAIAALQRWDELVLADPSNRALLSAARAAGAQRWSYVAATRSRDGLTGLEGIRSTDLLLAWFSGPCPAHKVTSGPLSDLAVDRLLVPFLQGELRGGRVLAAASRIALTFAATWTPTGATALLDALSSSTLTRATAVSVMDALSRSATQRAAEHADQARQGSSLAGAAPSHITPDGMQDAADWFLATLGPTAGKWSELAAMADALPVSMLLGDLAAVLSGVTRTNTC
jgi:hypothetical protein